MDRLAILRALNRMGSVTHSVRSALAEYKNAVPVIGIGTNAAGLAALRRITSNQRYGFLCDHATYQLACLTWEVNRPRESLSLFRTYLARFPHGLKVEEALIMMARAALLGESAQARDLSAAEWALNRLLARFPDTRFRRAAVGLRARVFYLKRKFRQALDCYFSIGDPYSVEIVRAQMRQAAPRDTLARLLAAYLRRLAAAESYETYSRSLADIARTRQSFGVRDAQIFSRLLDQDLSLPGPYFYYRLYHNENRNKELEQIATKAADIRRHHRAQLPPIVRMRFAEIEYQRKQYNKAIMWANSALSARAVGFREYGFDAQSATVPARALFVRGASRHKLRRLQPAIDDFRAILARYPQTPLKRSVREELALLYEAVGDLASAVDQYFELGYQADIAYMLDARMSIAQLEGSLTRNPTGTYTNTAFGDWNTRSGVGNIPRTLSKRDVLVYSLGIRCLRACRWDQAAYWLRQLPRATYLTFSRGRRDWGDQKTPDPLTAARELGHLERSVAVARSDNARAEALFRYASYYYFHGTLLLYNPALWQDEREAHFQFWWNKRHATAEDRRAVQRYMHEHEIYSRALEICERVIDRYPSAPVAPQSLYRAACAAAHLSTFNSWWRSEDDGHDHLGHSANLMARFTRLFPKNKLEPEAAKFARIWTGDAAEAARERADEAKQKGESDADNREAP